MVKSKIFVLTDDELAGNTLIKNLEILKIESFFISREIEHVIQHVEEKSPDIVLMDLSRQENLASFAAADHIRSKIGIPVIFIASFAVSAAFQRISPADPFSFIIKPYEAFELETVISTVLFKYRSERKLRQSEARFHTLFNIMAQGVLIQSSDGRIVSVNPAAERILGTSATEIIKTGSLGGHMITIHEDGTDFPEESHPGNEALRTKTNINNVVMGVFSPERKKYIWIRVYARPQIMPGTKILESVVTTFEDITDIKEYQDGLRTSESRYRSLINTIPDGISMMDMKGKYLTANPLALDMLGFSTIEELRSDDKKYFDFIQEPAWLKEPGELIEKLLIESPQRFEFLVSKKDGQKITVDANFTLMLDPTNQPYAILVISRDISSLKKKEAQLRKLSQAVVQSGDNIIITDTEGVIEYVNPQFEVTTGYKMDEVLGKTPRILKSGQQAMQFYVELWKTIKSGNIWRGEMHNRRKNRTLYWEEVSIAPVENENGIVTNYVAIKKDITERKELEDALRIKDMAISSSINAIALADLNGNLTYVNPAFVRMWGYESESEILKKSIPEFWQEGEPIDEVIRSLTIGNPWRGELVGKKKDGNTIVFDVSAHMVMDKNGNPTCMMSSFVDISARKQAEAAEKEEHKLVDALRRTSEALSSTLKLDDVLDLILENTGQVVDNDAISLMMIEGEIVRITRFNGKAGLQEKIEVEGGTFLISELPLLITMMETWKPMIVPDVKEITCWKTIKGMEWACSYAGVPIYKREQVIGFLNLYSATPHYFTEVHADRLIAFASQVAVAIENAMLYEQDHILSITDGLTGLFNSRYFFDLAKREFDRCRRYGSNLSVLMVDIDHFKNVNDTYGHLVGDEVLREAAKRLKNCLRVVDLPARYGGEEFSILMGQTDEKDAYRVANRIHMAFQGKPIDVSDGNSVSITVSIGVATQHAVHDDFNLLIKSADEALYFAKNQGRNQIAVWSSENITPSLL